MFKLIHLVVLFFIITMESIAQESTESLIEENSNQKITITPEGPFKTIFIPSDEFKNKKDFQNSKNDSTVSSESTSIETKEISKDQSSTPTFEKKNNGIFLKFGFGGGINLFPNSIYNKYIYSLDLNYMISNQTFLGIHYTPINFYKREMKYSFELYHIQFRQIVDQNFYIGGGGGIPSSVLKDTSSFSKNFSLHGEFGYLYPINDRISIDVNLKIYYLRREFLPTHTTLSPNLGLQLEF